MKAKRINIWWIRRDIRLIDNAVLNKAAQEDGEIVPVYILDPSMFSGKGQEKKLSFIFRQLWDLNRRLSTFGTAIMVFHGKGSDVFRWLKSQFSQAKIFTSLELGYVGQEMLKEAKKYFQTETVFEGYLLNFDRVRSKEGKVFRTFFHFKNAAYKWIEKMVWKEEENLQFKWYSLSTPSLYRIDGYRIEKLDFSLESLGLPEIQLYHEGAIRSPEELLKRFEMVLPSYNKLRDFPAKNATSLLSVHLRYGTICVREVLKWALGKSNSTKFIDEILWREFFSYLLYHYPESEFQDLRRNYERIWIKPSREDLTKLESAQFGIPIIDAGLNQLYLEGFVHNRVRMIIASYLTKDLQWDWRIGERLFAQHLIDYDPALNVGNWQWNAGVGVDPKSMYRRFNPFLQAEKFDHEGEYINRYLKAGPVGYQS